MIFHRFLLILLSIATAGLLCTAAAQNTTTPSQIDKKFVHSALEGGNTEVLLGNLAVQKAESKDIKQFGQKMIDDHTKLSERMREVARKEGISAPTGTAAKDKSLVNRLEKVSGPEFDKAYIRAMVKDHRDDLNAFNREANSGNDTEIKDVASQGAQVIGEHLKLAEQLARSRIGQPGY
jgi:putative membrane protein